MTNSFIFTKRNLPHLYFKDGIYFITSRVYGALPLHLIKELKESNHGNDDLSFDAFKNHFEIYDDFLNNKFDPKLRLDSVDVSTILIESINKCAINNFKIICYTIMPNHFHLVFELVKGNQGISKIMQYIKGNSSIQINKFLNRSGKFWQDESYDRWIRDEKELYFIIRYVLLNPVNAGLAKSWNEWESTYCHPSYIIM